MMPMDEHHEASASREDPLDHKLWTLISPTNNERLKIPALGSGGASREAYVSRDGQMVVVCTTDSTTGSRQIAVASEVKGAEEIARSRDREVVDSSGDAPRSMGIAGAVLGGLSMALYGVYEFTSHTVSAEDVVSNAILGPLMVVPAAVGSAGTFGAIGWALGHAVDGVSSQYKAGLEHRIARRAGHLWKSIDRASEAVIIPPVPHVSARFAEAVMSMVLEGPESKEFWERHALPTIRTVAEYESRINILDDAVDVDPRAKDKYILQFEAKSAVLSLVRAFDDRRRTIKVT